MKKIITPIVLVLSIGLGASAFLLHIVAQQWSRVELPVSVENGILKFNAPGECLNLNLELTFSEGSRDCAIDFAHFFRNSSVGSAKPEHVIVDIIDQKETVLMGLSFPDVKSGAAFQPFKYQMPASCRNAILRSSELSCVVQGSVYQKFKKSLP